MTAITNWASANGGSQAAAEAAARASASSTNGPSDGTDTAAGTEDRFLKLLVAQMRNQDPLNPLDNAQVTSQLAQINTVRGIEQLNASMTTMAAASSNVSPVAALGLLGRQVLVAGSEFEWSAGTAGVANPDPSMPEQASSKAARLGFELPAAARAVRIELVDASGQIVHVHEAADMEAGVHTFDWDGTDAEGAAVRDGNYRVRAYAVGYDSAELTIDPLVPARVSGVTQAPTGARVQLGELPAQPASAIRAIL
ncbi:MAG TPA: flagellar hook capping FlgD N-terminal domain-containing protein [Burkholderiaceae bacterium]|nr:flagellar hook capping FlgD N-terminal domain-containing protein [Burkholderiaceae bacterium]